MIRTMVCLSQECCNKPHFTLITNMGVIKINRYGKVISSDDVNIKVNTLITKYLKGLEVYNCKGCYKSKKCGLLISFDDNAVFICDEMKAFKKLISEIS